MSLCTMVFVEMLLSEKSFVKISTKFHEISGSVRDENILSRTKFSFEFELIRNTTLEKTVECSALQEPASTALVLRLCIGIASMQLVDRFRV
jgi:hypothetical protein